MDLCKRKMKFLFIVMRLIFFDHLDFQIVKRNFFNEIILCKPCFAVPFKIGNSGFQPDRLPQIELQADFL